jgi:hypothetical protein
MHAGEDELVLLYYGDLPAQEETRVAAHVNACRECHALYRRLQQVLTAIPESAGAGPDAPDGFERAIWARLEPALPALRRGFLARFAAGPVQVAWAAGVVVLVVAAFIAGRWSPAPEPAAAATAGAARDRVLRAELGDHLERAQRVLVDLVAADGGGSVDITGERQRAEQLLAGNRLYRDAAASTGDARLADLLDQLERVLVDVAASPAAMPARDLDAVRRRIESGSLLFKVGVDSSELEDRRETADGDRGNASSL